MQDEDNFSFYLKLNTKVKIQVANDRFRVDGPPRATAILNRVIHPSDVHGRLSPITPLSLAASARAKVGIPTEATHYCFAYPLDCLRSDFDSLLLSFVGAADHTPEDEAVLMFFLVGGFCYFSIDALSAGGAPRLLAVNALSLKEEAAGGGAELRFEGPYTAPAEAAAALSAAGRMANVSIARLLDAGISSFAWINPGEDPGGVSLGVPAPHGAFIYRRELRSDLRQLTNTAPPAQTPSQQVFYYVLRPNPSRGEDGQPATSSSGEAAHVASDAAAIDGVFVKMIDAFSVARREAAELEHDLVAWRESALAKWLRSYGVLLPAYYVLGIVVYGLLEGWSVLDVTYYLTTTVTTVGYGDFCPSTAAGRWFTSFYAPLGTITVMSALLPPVEAVLLRLDELTAWPVYKLENLALRTFSSRWELLKRTHLRGKLRQLAKDRSAASQPVSRAQQRREEQRADQVSHAVSGSQSLHMVELCAWGGSTVKVSGRWARLHALMGPLLLGGLGVVLSLWFHGYSLCDALYWTIITMTTVGYGDLLPETVSQKLYAMLFMPLAATTLAATVERFEKLTTAQRIHETNFTLVADTMLREEAIIQQTLHPELSAEAFVLRVLVEENLVEEQTLKELKARYTSMLHHGKGQVKGEGRVDAQGVPKTVDAELIFALLVQQGRIIDSNLLDSRRQLELLQEESLQRKASKQKMAKLRGRESGMGRGDTRGAIDSHDSDGVMIVDMSASDGGFREWYERSWIPSLQESGVQASLADEVRFIHRMSTVGETGVGELDGPANGRPPTDDASAEMSVGGLRGGVGGVAATAGARPNGAAKRGVCALPSSQALPAPVAKSKARADGYTRLEDGYEESGLPADAPPIDLSVRQRSFQLEFDASPRPSAVALASAAAPAAASHALPRPSSAFARPRMASSANSTAVAPADGHVAAPPPYRGPAIPALGAPTAPESSGSSKPSSTAAVPVPGLSVVPLPPGAPSSSLTDVYLADSDLFDA